MPSSFTKLQSEQSSKRLEKIASLRSCGVGEHIDLPQLVVCGDQSAGKSSVLEGLTGIPFPRQDGLCTRFATEIILTHTDGEPRTDVEIIPCASRSEQSKEELAAYTHQLDDFAALPALIADVSILMGLRGIQHPDGPAFGQDVLRIKVQRPIGLHLTIVDLPGLISVASEEQSEDDLQFVHALVDRYMENSRTIILAVVQAGNDIANQGIIQKAKRFDPPGERTVGIITKPDLVNIGTENRIAMLSRNQDKTKLKLGFFLLKNPSPSELQEDVSLEQREHLERDFFANPPWRQQSLDETRVGVAKLRKFLQLLLDRHIERELPAVRDEIQALLESVDQQLFELGEERSTSAHVRIFLSRLAIRFHNLTTAALQGEYHTTEVKFFASEKPGREFIRLRAHVHGMNTRFAKVMRQFGAGFKVCNTSDRADLLVDGEKVDGYHALIQGQKRISNDAMSALISDTYSRSRGRELPGNYNHTLLTELFRLQSSRWIQFAAIHLDHVDRELMKFMVEAMAHLSVEDQVRLKILERIKTRLSRNKLAAQAELGRICTDKDGPPITYNHYFTDNVQNSRHDTTRNLIKKALEEVSIQEFNKKMHISNTSVDAEKLLGALQRRVLVDMDEQACSEARVGLEAFYKVARKTFVDNVCIQVIERHLLRDLTDGFSPDVVASFNEDELRLTGGEEEATTTKRHELRALQENLGSSLHELRMV